MKKFFFLLLAGLALLSCATTQSGSGAGTQERKGGDFSSEKIETIEIPNFNNAFIMLKRGDYSYSSGLAHGISQTTYYVLDMNEGRILNLEEMLTILPEDLLKAAITPRHAIDFDFRDSVWPPDSICFDQTGVILFWNVYSIAPYAEGPIEITLPYDKVNNYLTKKGVSIKESFVK
jgi:hypothetical protein